MNSNDALHILGLTVAATQTEIKIAFRMACKKYHPDRNPGGLEMMKLVNAANDSLQTYRAVTPTQEENTSYGDEINAALNAIAGLGLTVEICGAWVWVSGEKTRQYREILKSAGFKWAPNKVMWHFRPTDYKSSNRGTWAIEKIREKYGSQSVNHKSPFSLPASF